MAAKNTSRPPGEQFAELERILGGGSMDDIQVSMVSGKHDKMTWDEFCKTHKEKGWNDDATRTGASFRP